MEEQQYGELLVGNVNKAVRQGSFPSHRHPMAELYVCLGGRATDLLDGREREVLPGDVFVHTAEGIHTQRDMKDFRCYVFQFHMERLTRRAEALGLLETDGFRSLLATREGDACLFVEGDTLRLVEQMADMMRSEERPAILDTLFLSILAVLSAKGSLRTANTPTHAADATLDALLAYIKAHYAEELTLGRLSSLSHYSGRHVARLFRERLGTSPMAYLDAVRLEAAAGLLLHTEADIAEIGLRSGFPDNSLFSRHFRAHFGISPTEYRRRHSTPTTPTLSGFFEMRDPEEEA